MLPQKTELIEQFRYLDDLRESAVTNMWGAGAYLRPAFNLSERQASDVLCAWQRTFDGKSSVEDRVALVSVRK